MPSPPRKPRRAPDPRLYHADLHSYGEVSRSRSEVYHPATVDELRGLLAELSASGERRVTFRAGGCSLDGQSLNDDVVIFLDRIDEIVIHDDPNEPTVTVGAGARWGDIARALEAVGLVPFVAVSTSRATAGGTASADCLSRFSSSIGKESRFIRKLRVLTLDGVLHEVSRDSTSADDRALFHAVIGGFGYLGVIVRITYAVWRPPAPGFPRTPLRVSTLVKKCGDLRSFVGPLADHAPRPEPRPGGLGANTTYALHDIAHGFFSRAAACAADGSPADPTAFYGVVCPGGSPRGLVFESRYVRSDTLRPMLQHVPAHPLRFLAEWTARGRFTGGLFWWFTYELFDEAPYLDDLLGYTFFMDGNVRTRALERRLGFTTFTLQQTYVVPFSPEALREFLGDALQRLDTRGLVPLLFDVLYIPADDALLSASRDLDGFAVTIAFETRSRAEVRPLEDALSELSDACLARGGRVLLGKTVCATPDVLRAMYAGPVAELRALKDRYDPARVLGNRFLEERFPELLAPRVAPS